MTEDGLPRAWICERDILERLDPPLVIAPCEDRQDQRVDVVRARGVRRAGAQPTPEMNDRCVRGKRGGVDQLVRLVSVRASSTPVTPVR